MKIDMKIPYLITTSLYITRLHIMLAVLIFLISGCSSRQLLSPEKSLTRLMQNANWQQEVDLLVNPLIESNDNIGVVVAILDENQQISVFPYGHKNKESLTAMSQDTLFGIGSTTKSMVVSLMLALDDQHIISVNDTIGELLPHNMVFKDHRIQKITFAQLASHTSGLPREPFDSATFSSLMKYFFTGNNLYDHLTEKYVYDFLQNFELAENLSEAPTYSNIGIGLLAHLLTIKTGQDLETLLNQYLFKPLNMKKTVIKLDPTSESTLATGYAGDQPLFVPWNTPLDNWIFSSVMVGTGGVYSTAPDLIKYLKAHLAESNTRLDTVLKQSRKILGRDGSHFLTMGWYVDYLPKYDTHLYYYHGMVSGFNCYIGFEPRTEVAVVVLRNNFNWGDVVGHNLLLRLAQFAMLKKSQKSELSAN